MTAHCPPQEQLERLLDDCLEAAEDSALARHVESCAECQDRLERLFADSLSSLGHAPTNPEMSDALLMRLKKRGRRRDETVEFAGHQKLDNLILIYDSNNVTLDAMAKETQSLDAAERFTALGWDVITIDGDTARLTALVEAQHLLAADPGTHALLKNPYTVDLVRDGDRWRIRRMRIENTWLTGDPIAIFGL